MRLEKCFMIAVTAHGHGELEIGVAVAKKKIS